MILFPFLLTLLLIALVAPAVGRAGTVTASAGLLASAQANPTDVEVRVAAIHAAEEAVQATNSAPLAIRRLATAYALDGQTERAIALLEKVYAREPRSPLIKADLVALYEQAGRDEQAGELLRLTGQSADSLAARGSQALAQGDTIQVMELYRQAELLGATLTSSRHYLASQVLNQEGDAAAAERELALAIEIDQGWATQEERFQAWVTWGNLLYRQAQPEPALQALTYAITIAPATVQTTTQMAALYRARALVLMQLAQSEPALADLEQAVAIAPNYAWANMSYGLVLYELVPEQRADAVASIQQAFALEPENRDLWHGLLRMIGRLEATELREMYCAQIPSGIELDLEIQKAACQ